MPRYLKLQKACGPAFSTTKAQHRHLLFSIKPIKTPLKQTQSIAVYGMLHVVALLTVLSVAAAAIALGGFVLLDLGRR
jgi:hypothetical protein